MVKTTKKYLSNREFYGDDFYLMMQRSFDDARRFLKSCGRPKDKFDEILIKIAKEEAKVCALFLD